MEQTQSEPATVPEAPQSDQFLSNIYNQRIYWTFHIIGRKVVTGRVVNFLWDERGVPITLMVKADKQKAVEIPWSSIQTVTRGLG